MNEDCTLSSESSQILCVPVGVWRGEGRVPRCHFVQGSTAPVRVYKCTDCCSQTDFELRLQLCSTNSRKLFILWKNGNWKLWLLQGRGLSKFWLVTVLKSIYFCLQLNCHRLSHRHQQKTVRFAKKTYSRVVFVRCFDAIVFNIHFEYRMQIWSTPRKSNMA